MQTIKDPDPPKKGSGLGLKAAYEVLLKAYLRKKQEETSRQAQEDSSEAGETTGKADGAK